MLSAMPTSHPLLGAPAVQAIEDLNRQTGSHIDPLADPNDIMRNNTRSLMSAVSSLPELTGGGPAHPGPSPAHWLLVARLRRSAMTLQKPTNGLTVVERLVAAPRSPAAEKKRVIDKHTNLATALLGAIKARQLDAFYALEEECLAGKADAAAVAQQLRVGRGRALLSEVTVQGAVVGINEEGRCCRHWPASEAEAAAHQRSEAGC